MTIANTAADLARRHGFKGFRVASDKKKPAFRGWQDEATSDPGALAKLLEGRAAWGIKTGDGLLVIDFDSDDALLDFRINHGELPETFTVKTRRGWHYFFHVKEDYKGPQKWLGLDIDLRCRGNLVIGPGSVIGESAYRIHRDVPIADFPEQWLALLPADDAAKERGEDVTLTGPHRGAMLMQAIEYARQVEPAVEGQGGDLHTLKVAMHLHELGAEEEDAYAVMAELFNDRCSPPWSMPDLRKKIASAYSSAQNAKGSLAPGQAFEAITDGPRDPLLFSAHRWLGRDIPPLDYLLGNVFSTVTRAELIGPTGIGKSNLALAFGWAMAYGNPFLHWQARRPARKVVYIDGEMSARVARDRVADAARRHGGAPDNLLLINRDDFPDLPPLNTKAGQNFVDDLMSQAGEVEFVIFDNIQSLITGDMKEEDGWAATLPWVRALTRRAIGQLWVHHTGLNTTRGYGSSTKEWQLDTVMLMTDRADKGDLLVDFDLSFTKARERNRNNRADFVDARIWINTEDRWESSVAPSKNPLRLELDNAMTAFDRAQRAKALAANPAATEEDVLSTPINRSEWAIYFEAFKPTKRRKGTPIQDSAAFRLLGQLAEMLVELSSVQKIQGKHYVRTKDGKDGKDGNDVFP